MDSDVARPYWWCYPQTCKYGHIFIAGRQMLGADAAGRLISGKLAALPGIRVRQRTDNEVNVAFPPEVFLAAAAAQR